MKKKADELLNIWYHKAHEMEKLHSEAYHYYNNNDAFITIPTIIISSIAGSINFVSVGFCNTKYNMYYSLGAGCLNVLATIMASIRPYFSWNSKYYKHNATSIAYLKVKNLIEIQLSLHKLGLNLPYAKMIPEIGSLITKIDNEAPPLPPHIVSKISISKCISMELIINSDTDDKEISTTTENKIIDTYSNVGTEYNNVSIDDIETKLNTDLNININENNDTIDSLV